MATGMNQKDASVQKPQVKENENTTGTKQKQNIVVCLNLKTGYNKKKRIKTDPYKNINI